MAWRNSVTGTVVGLVNPTYSYDSRGYLAIIAMRIAHSDLFASSVNPYTACAVRTLPARLLLAIFVRIHCLDIVPESQWAQATQYL